jgi:cobalamin biosynthesis Mg chelatase CobN
MTRRLSDETLALPAEPSSRGAAVSSANPPPERGGSKAMASQKREIEMNRTGGVGILGVIVIVVVILFLVGVIKL